MRAILIMFPSSKQGPGESFGPCLPPHHERMEMIMKFRSALAVMALYLSLDAHAATGGSVDLVRLYDSVLGQAQLYALMDPSRVPGPASGALIVVGLSLLVLSVARGWRRGA
jgi:hypothetical protein